MATVETNMREGQMNDLPVLAAKKILKGEFVFVKAATGLAYGADATDTITANDRFMGVAVEEVDNTLGASGAEVVRVWAQGVHQYPTAAFAVADNGKKAKLSTAGVLAVADDTFSVGTIVSATATMIDLDISNSIGSVAVFA